MSDTKLQHGQDAQPAIRSAWVVGSYIGENAKHILANASAGVGSYIILDQSGSNIKPSCTVAFRKAIDGPLPDHLLEVKDPRKIRQYEDTRKERQGLNERH